MIFFLVSGLKNRLWLLFRINVGYQQYVACRSKLTKLLVNVVIFVGKKSRIIQKITVYLPGIYLTNWTSQRCCYANDDTNNWPWFQHRATKHTV